MAKFGISQNLKRSLFFLVLTFFWYTGDSILTYISPLLVESRNSNLALIGLLMSLGSIAGILTDLFSSWLFFDKHFPFFYISAFIIALGIPILLPFSGLLPVVLIIIIGGIQFELFSFGQEDFLSHHIKKQSQVLTSGMLLTVTTVSGLLVPLMMTYGVDQDSFNYSFALYSLFMVAGFGYFLLGVRKKRKSIKTERPKHRVGLLTEIKIWTILGSKTRSVFLVMVCLMLLDAVFWTLGPLVSIHYAEQSEYAVLFLPAYILPGLFVSFYAPYLSKVFGDLRAAILTLLISVLILASFFFVENIIVLIGLVFLSSIFNSATFPIIEGILAQLIDRLGDDGAHLIGLRGFSTDIGYIIGPVLAGLFAEFFSIKEGFVYVGLGIALVMVFTMITNPKTIRLPRKDLKTLQEG